MSFGDFIEDFRLFSRTKPSPSLKDQVTLETIRKTLAEDKRYMTRHPILKHLYSRYDAILNDIGEYGTPVSKIEPAREFSNRVNEVTVEVVNKDTVRKNKRRRRTRAKENIARNKEQGRNYHDRTK